MSKQCDETSRTRSSATPRFAVFTFSFLLASFACFGAGGRINAIASESDAGAKSLSEADTRIVQAFRKTHQGYSSDEVILQDNLRIDFLRELNSTGTPLGEREALLKLLQLRKAGKLTAKSTRRGPPIEAEISTIAEIATRVVTDRHEVSTDTLLVTPDLRNELLTEAKKLMPNADGYSIRKAALQLRKKRALRPELVLRVADWDRKVLTYSLGELKKQLHTKKISSGPGIYLFRHATDGYLYIGEAANLTTRLTQHLAESDRLKLAELLETSDPAFVTIELHVFPKESPAKSVRVRRAYESELIRSRKPKFNVRP